MFLCPPLKWVTLSIPIVKSFHSRISYLDFSWHTSLSIESCWGPWGALRGPLGGPSVPEKGKQNASNHQISLYPPLKWVTLSIPIVKSSQSKIFYLNFSRHTSLTTENHSGPYGALHCLKTAKKNASNHQISLHPPLKWVTLSIPIVKSSHSRIFYLDFLWHTSLSIENHWGPLEAVRGPFSAWKRHTKRLKSSRFNQNDSKRSKIT